MADTITRRHLAGFSAALATSAAGLSASLPANAQQAPVAPAAPQELLDQRKANRVRAAEELASFDLGYADEPLFRLVLK